MKFKKLNAAGFSHDMLLVGFVVIFAITGVAYLVASHADSCPQPVSGAVSGAVSSPVSGAVSGSQCTPASGPVSSVVSSPTPTPTKLTASCIIGGVPDSDAPGTVLTPTLTITNTGTGAIAPAMISFAAITHVPSSYFKNIVFPAITPGQSASQKLSSYSLPASLAKTTAQIFSHSDLNNNGTKTYFECSKSFTIVPVPTPTPPPIPTPVPKPVASPITIEAESMATRRDNYILNDAKASGGKYRALYHNDHLTKAFATTGSMHQLTIRAKGSQCNGVPRMLAYLDGKLILSSFVSSTSWANYNTAVSLAPQSHSLLIAFVNDRYTKTCDRNLYVDVATLQP